jgi:hypothetical protein
MDLSKFDDSSPEITERIGGLEFKFSELPFTAMLRLQSWIRANTPHPVESIAGHLDGLADADRIRMLDKAQELAMHWPPEIGTLDGAQALLGSEAGQVEAFREGLSVHHGDVSTDEAWRIYRTLKRDIARDTRKGGWAAQKAGDRVRRIYGVLFGSDDDGRGLPKDPAAADASDGMYLSAAANGNSGCASGSGAATPSVS